LYLYHLLEYSFNKIILQIKYLVFQHEILLFSPSKYDLTGLLKYQSPIPEAEKAARVASHIDDDDAKYRLEVLKKNGAL
jgi:hypothetical protein